MSIVAYISGHGLGHSAREVEVLRHLPEAIPLVLKTRAPEWFWRAELRRPFTLVADSFDVGCVQRDGLTIDAPATLAAWREMEERNAARLDEETDDLRRCGCRVVVTDVPSFPLRAAARAGIPSVCVANFTWVEIYRHLAVVEREPGLMDAAARLEAEYALASLMLETGFAVPMPEFPRQESVGIVARPGQERREALREALPPVARGKRLALVYVGGWGLPIPYERVTEFPDWHFLSLDAPPAIPVNWTVLPRDLLAHPDLVASVDLVVSKPGYGLAGECVSLGIPTLYPPRPQFAEYAALDAALAAWPGGRRISLPDFLSVSWREGLDWAASLRNVPRLPTPGGPLAAQRITDLYG